MQIDTEIIAALCWKHAPDLLTPKVWEGTPIDKVRLLWGFAGVESTFGLDCTPRHEPGYCHGGKYFNRIASRVWGCLAHCSYGPWQVMFANFPYGVSPLSLMWETDGRVPAEVVCVGAVRYLNSIIARGASNLSQLVIGYNGPANEEEYSARLVDCLDKPMPAAKESVEV